MEHASHTIKWVKWHDNTKYLVDFHPVRHKHWSIDYVIYQTCPVTNLIFNILYELAEVVVEVDGEIFEDFDTVETFASETEAVDIKDGVPWGTLMVVSVWSNVSCALAGDNEATEEVDGDLKAGEAV